METLKNIFTWENCKKVFSCGWTAIKWIFKILWQFLCVLGNWFVHIFTGLTKSDIDDLMVAVKDSTRADIAENTRVYGELRDQIAQLRAELETLREEIAEVHNIDTVNNGTIIEQTETVKEEERKDV